MTQQEPREQNQVIVQSNVPPAPTQAETFLSHGGKPHRIFCKVYYLANLGFMLTLSERWLYSLILTIDANFHLKNKERKIFNDLPLGDGWASWVQEGPYREYINEYGHQEEVSNDLLPFRSIAPDLVRYSLIFASRSFMPLIMPIKTSGDIAPVAREVFFAHATLWFGRMGWVTSRKERSTCASNCAAGCPDDLTDMRTWTSFCFLPSLALFSDC